MIGIFDKFPSIYDFPTKFNGSSLFIFSILILLVVLFAKGQYLKKLEELRKRYIPTQEEKEAYENACKVSKRQATAIDKISAEEHEA